MANNLLDQVFSRCRNENRAALVGYLTAGDPNISDSTLLLHHLAIHADIIEIGMPFSDPMADGAVIQAASERALASGCTLADVFSLTQSVRRQHPDVGIVLMGYANTPYSIGFESFAAQAADAGANGVLLVDIPPEECGICREAFQQHQLKQIFLLSPTSSEDRIQRVIEVASGFIYYVALTGVTGAELGETSVIKARVEILRQRTSIPICVGFGIKTVEKAHEIACFSDGVVIGSAFVSIVTASDTKLFDASDPLLKIACNMRSAMKRPKK
ncbi:MAG: tryptophan synthase subunit alpha [Mariprofundaceae bacterium]|nr:tryptophan synthase subunit alpha [Mariprofundaceae bacterium]